MAEPQLLRLTVDTLARWEPDPQAVYDRIWGALETFTGDQDALAAVLVVHAHRLSHARLLMLLDRAIHRVVYLIAYEVGDWIDMGARGAFELEEGGGGDDYYSTSTGRHARDALIQLVRRVQMDQAGWDFIGVSLIGAFIAHTATNDSDSDSDSDSDRDSDSDSDGDSDGDGSMVEYDFDGDDSAPVHRGRVVEVASALGAHVLDSLIECGGQRLEWHRLLNLTRVWVQRGGAVYQLGSSNTRRPIALTPDTMAAWRLRLRDEQAVRLAWDSATQAANRRMQRDAHDAQNELRRDPRLGGDVSSAIAQFLAPPGTTQATLKEHREHYIAQIGVAHLQLRANAHPADGGLQRRANLARGALHGRPGEELHLPAPEPATPLQPPSRDYDEGEGEADGEEEEEGAYDRSKKQRTGGRPVRPW